ncbi:MFS transporter [Mycolicibacterium fluoranthenivorans]|jgi:MFS family permease|uniref:Predicted arabinose efflux permease, MFS family n=1 Tax=Mycolicibacterium fluoranthenivorans TaxID=258505 RepID=A0A1G4WXQ1_9MYCO|nr:MFS transporter [Mycolicibacterium fluoranthenivorans]SCX31878.1 Predicted arabinose efflux permease, MFS family [Mycolicibacterium fluoranthenivorans]
MAAAALFSGVNTRRRLAFPLLAFAFAAVMLGTTLPTPMYALYAAQMHFAVLTTTIVFAAYAIGVLGALLVVGGWSDAIGRRPVLLGGLVFALASAVVFLFADSVAVLLVGRLLSGLSAGIFTGTATAAVVEALPAAQRERGAVVATVANIGGLGTGPILAGLLVQYEPHALTLPFVVHIVLVVLAIAAVLIAPETSDRTGRIGMQRLSVPVEARAVFITAATAAFAGFAVMGLFTSVAPAFVANVVGNDNHAVGGAVASSIFLASAVAQLAGRRIAPARAVAAGSAVLVIGMVILAAALHFSSLTGILVAALVAGTGQGISFSRGLAAVVEQVPTERRAEVSSTYFVVAYVAISLPVVGAGLAAHAWGLRTAGEVFAVVVAALAMVCLAAILVQERRGTPASA